MALANADTPPPPCPLPNPPHAPLGAPTLKSSLPHLHKQDTGWWMLKNNKQRGTGLRLVPTSRALQAAFETTTRPGMEGITLYRWYLAQQYINRCVCVPPVLPMCTAYISGSTVTQSEAVPGENVHSLDRNCMLYPILRAACPSCPPVPPSLSFPSPLHTEPHPITYQKVFTHPPSPVAFPGRF